MESIYIDPQPILSRTSLLSSFDRSIVYTALPSPGLVQTNSFNILPTLAQFELILLYSTTWTSFEYRNSCKHQSRFKKMALRNLYRSSSIYNAIDDPNTTAPQTHVTVVGPFANLSTPSNGSSSIINMLRQNEQGNNIAQLTQNQQYATPGQFSHRNASTQTIDNNGLSSSHTHRLFDSVNNSNLPLRQAHPMIVGPFAPANTNLHPGPQQRLQEDDNDHDSTYYSDEGRETSVTTTEPEKILPAIPSSFVLEQAQAPDSSFRSNTRAFVREVNAAWRVRTDRMVTSQVMMDGVGK